ncbi:winged helix-turn-helix domain-containing protein [Paenibacillus contaminans]|uniref:Transcriptional regulator n=1 Tax=Paenibacillus contaminans TaxID=450362 RepID=A0A329MHI0_9BACL|nr:transcriptional regulator [Paenibacillus contaminans]RAV19349.1 transcriptional regulator [Paenibacillus contaminans]
MNENILDAIDDTIHAKARLGIMSLLAVHKACDFVFLRKELQMTEGNLGNHIRVLEEAGYIQVTKTFAGRRPKTICTSTELGMDMFRQYIEGLERIIRMAQAAIPKPDQK